MPVSAFSIGRRSSNDVTLQDPSVSGCHAELVRAADGRYYLCDCKSTNGTFVDKQGQWQGITQTFVESHHAVRFGNVTTTVGQLLQQLPSPQRRPDTGEVLS
ncbi:FHA domain-containing protein [Corallincola platygyrae]|uniref:FHA domain-containing protein n=1 Tax=Corallincola platygyrae TaxID=1193278 RepID=A0ABW4XQN1_9GAMM